MGSLTVRTFSSGNETLVLVHLPLGKRTSAWVLRSRQLRLRCPKPCTLALAALCLAMCRRWALAR